MDAIAAWMDREPSEAWEALLKKPMEGDPELARGSCWCFLQEKGEKQALKTEEKELLWQGKTYWLLFSGKLFNAPELRRELEGLGHLLKTGSDREIVLHSYAQWNQSCLHRFNGVFAFVISDGQSLFLARDRIGVKPLFYRKTGGELLLASELRTLLKLPGVEAQLDRQGASELILLGPGRMPGSGVLKGIRELEPGCFGRFSRGNLEITRYWKLSDREHRDSFRDTAEKVRCLLFDAVARQTEGEGSYGTFLSGGLDSSILTAICAGTNPGLRTYSVSYRDQDRYFEPGKFQPESDDAYVAEMTGALGCPHSKTVLTPEDLIGELEAATEARGLPGMGDVDFSLLAFCRQVRKSVPMVLSGECADEIFGGYPWYRDPEIRARSGFPWAQNTALRCSLLAFPRENARELVEDCYADTCRQADILPGTDPENRRIRELVNLNFRWFMQTLLSRNETMSNAVGLTVRVPFCDYRIAEYLYSVPWEMKDHLGREKGLLRYAVRGLLPEAVRMRRKSPYPKTFDPQYEALVTARLRQLTEEDSPLWYLVSRDRVRLLLSGELQQPWYGQLMRRPQTVAWLLQMDFWLRHWRIQFDF